MQILEDTLLTPHLSGVISLPNSGLDNMLDQDQIDNLARLFRLFTMVPAGLATLKRSLKDSVLRRGTALNPPTDAEDERDKEEFVIVDADPKGKGKGKARAQTSDLDVASKWVEEVLNLKEKFDRILKQAFSGDRELEAALNEVCLFRIRV